VRGPAQFDAGLTQAGIARSPFREYIAGLDYLAADDSITAEELKNHWPPFAWSHADVGRFAAATGIPAGSAKLIASPVTPFFDGVGVLVIPAIGAGVDVASQLYFVTLDLFKLDGSAYDPEDFFIFVQVRSYE
jgi:hypothetical protein